MEFPQEKENHFFKFNLQRLALGIAMIIPLFILAQICNCAKERSQEPRRVQDRPSVLVPVPNPHLFSHGSVHVLQTGFNKREDVLVNRYKQSHRVRKDGGHDQSTIEIVLVLGLVIKNHPSKEPKHVGGNLDG